MPKFLVTRTQQIKAPKEKVFATIRDLSSWQEWSPWLVADPETRLDFSADGKSYSWQSEIVGEGRMEVVNEVPGEQMDCALEFLKPWKSQALAKLILAEKDGVTEVKWQLHGSVPIFMFFMKSMMEVWVGGDYERGLLMLKDCVETGEVGFQLKFLGEQDVQGFHYAGVSAECKIKEIAQSMKRSCDYACSSLQSEGMEATGPMFCQIEKWDMKRGECAYTVGLPLAEKPGLLPHGMEPGEMPSCRVYVIEHHGRYHHLGNAWASGMMRGQKKIFVRSKRIKPFEVYAQLPCDGDESGAITRVCFPVRA